jgi:hypothetical protein
MRDREKDFTLALRSTRVVRAPLASGDCGNDQSIFNAVGATSAWSRSTLSQYAR